MKHLFFDQKTFDYRLKAEKKATSTRPCPIITLFVNDNLEIVAATQTSGIREINEEHPNADYVGSEKQMLCHMRPSDLAKHFGKTKDQIVTALNKDQAKTLNKLKKLPHTAN